MDSLCTCSWLAYERTRFFHMCRFHLAHAGWERRHGSANTGALGRTSRLLQQRAQAHRLGREVRVSIWALPRKESCAFAMSLVDSCVVRCARQFWRLYVLQKSIIIPLDREPCVFLSYKQSNTHLVAVARACRICQHRSVAEVFCFSFKTHISQCRCVRCRRIHASVIPRPFPTKLGTYCKTVVVSSGRPPTRIHTNATLGFPRRFLSWPILCRKWLQNFEKLRAEVAQVARDRQVVSKCLRC